MVETKAKPIKSYKEGRISLSIWENNGKDDTKYKSAKLEIGYKKEEETEWKHKSINFNSKDEYKKVLELLKKAEADLN